MIQIILMDDHQMVRDGMKVVLESAEDIVVIGEASEPDELKKLLAVRQPNVVVLDLVIGRLLVGFNVLEVLHAKHKEGQGGHYAFSIHFDFYACFGGANPLQLLFVQHFPHVLAG